MTAAGYLEGGVANTNYSTSYAYDKHGNMTNLIRNGRTGTSTFGTIDNLSMSYAGNQLIKADDAGTNVTLSASMDFKNNSTAAKEYFYDLNGNLTRDLNKGITGITYNLLNLPQSVAIANTLGQATNTYTYAADGRKLRTVQQWSGTNSKQTDYVDNVIYESVNGTATTLKRILVDGGYIEGGAYYFYLTDHLGNNRVVANANGGIVQTSHYYPFGMSFAEGVTSSGQPYKYNGKELDTERGLNLYDYSARLMDPALARFSTMDPLAEKYYSWSPYHYGANNPIITTDPTEMDWYRDSKGNGFWQEGSANTVTRDDIIYLNIGATYTQNIDNHTSITYTQNSVTSVTYTGINKSDYVSQTGKTGCKVASDQMLANDGGNSNGKRINVVNADPNGVATTPTKNADKGINAINKALENGHAIEVGVDYSPVQLHNKKPNGDGMTDHFIVVSSKTETLNNGQVTYKSYNFFDPRQKAYGINPLNTLTTQNNILKGAFHGTRIIPYTVTTIRTSNR